MIEYIKEKLVYEGAISIGDIYIKISSNIPLSGIKALNNNILINAIGVKANYHIVLYQCKSDSNVFINSLKYRDSTVRNKYLNKGYYVCDHFGTPINIVREGEYIIVFGNEIERILWSYIIKYIMQIWAIENNAIFAKCAAFSLNGQATVLIGRGGSGKTVINSVVCKNAGTFITNSNAIIKDNKIIGFGSNIRIRNDLFYDSIFSGLSIEESLVKNEYMVNPFDIFNCDCSSWFPIKNYIIINYITGSHHIAKITNDVCLNYAEQFLLGINVYRLEEDVLDYFSSNCEQFADQYSQIKMQLMQSISNCNCYYADVDINNKEILSEFLELL